MGTCWRENCKEGVTVDTVYVEREVIGALDTLVLRGQDPLHLAKNEIGKTPLLGLCGRVLLIASAFYIWMKREGS